MGLIYVSSESQDLINSLTSNLKSAQADVKKLKDASQKIIEAVDGKTLSGTAYKAAKGVFSDVILPTIAQVTNVFDSMSKDLSKYKQADQKLNSESYLSEDQLNAQIQIKKNMKSAVEATAQTIKKTAGKLLDTSGAQKNMASMANNLESDIRRLQKKLEKLRNFNSEVNGLFDGIMDDYKSAIKKVLVLKTTITYKDGSYKTDDKSIADEIIEGIVEEGAKKIFKAPFESMVKKIFKEKKNIGRAWAAKLQPRDVKGRFVKDTNKLRKEFTGSLKGMKNSFSEGLGVAAKKGIKVIDKGFDALDFYNTYKDFNDDNHNKNIGRGVVYSGAVTGGSILAGVGIDSAVDGLIGLGVVATLPEDLVTGAVVLSGVGIAYGADYLYKNNKTVRNAVNWTGDRVDDVGNSVKKDWKSATSWTGNMLNNVGKSFKGSF
ncbi:T7SS effector LXG polymorphic toxin [Bombilactobacillus thymidiniphilus]|uniref:LXG domain-containing protein n=1 Tax=Bombilactobacillus thymidiniphilus TaxID=2923363 RepID=A0ABY4PF44_9LACO|nr:T7SS effector LXG polymorphic toxin [Bombilactobacillus thymidiniphilus]UQS84172.1 LXG domain-containing protein [Bombilactobacillus thymidiniphilus]